MLLSSKNVLAFTATGGIGSGVTRKFAQERTNLSGGLQRWRTLRGARLEWLLAQLFQLNQFKPTILGPQSPSF